MVQASVSVIIPALNEERWVGACLDDLAASFAAHSDLVCLAECIVVDNGSDDGTAAVAAAHGARVVSEHTRGVARARNAGARAARGDLLVFVDADTRVPPEFAHALAPYAADARCVGGAFDTEYRPKRRLMKAYLGIWRILGVRFGLAQGAAQFCRRTEFDALSGYDERIFMGEDVEFFARMRRFAASRGGYAVHIRDVRVLPSTRRFDQWPAWKVLVWTNPAVIALLSRRRSAWRGWYETPPR